MNSPKHIIIIGGAGFIGQRLRQMLAAEGYALTIIGRSLAPDLGPGEVFYSVREYSLREIIHHLQDTPVTAIIDLAYASVPNTSYADPIADFSENLRNVIQHLDFALAVRAGQFIYVSSGGTVYGDSVAQRAFTEEDVNFPLSPYGITKMACERYVFMYNRLHGLPAAIVRPANVYGPGQLPFRGQGLVATALGLARKGEPINVFGSGSHIRDYVFIDDFCAALSRIVSLGLAGEIYNIGTGMPTSIRHLIEVINDIIREDGLTLAEHHLPERPFDVHYNVLNIDKVSAATGWKPTSPLRNGITATWHWMKELVQHPEKGNA